MYRPSGGAGADPFAFTDAAVLAGASRLALLLTSVLTAGGEKENLNVSSHVPSASRADLTGSSV